MNPVYGRARADRSGNRRRWPYVVLLVAVLAAGALAQTPPGRDLLRSTGVAGAPAGYTELAFINPQNLPRELIASTRANGPAFEIHNATGDGRRYRWSVTLTSSAGNAVQSTTGDASLSDGQRATITPTVQVKCKPGPLSVTVTLATSGESIGFKADCLPANSGQLS